MTECKLDKMVNKLNHILNKTLDKSCPVAKARSIDPTEGHETQSNQNV